MKIRRILPYLLSLLILICSVGATDASARRKSSSKARTSQSSTKKSKSKKKKSKKKRKKSSSKKKRNSSSKSTRSRRTNRARTSSSRWTNHKEAPAETILSDSLTLLVNEAVIRGIPDNMNPGGLRVNAVRPNQTARTVDVSLNDNFTYLPVTKDFISQLQNTVRRSLPDSLSNFRPNLNVKGKALSYYINHVEKLPVSARVNVPFVRALKPDVKPVKGMYGDKLALWHSHGRYFKSGAWQWQRPLLYETVEDIYTMGYMLPFIVPMLENAGAYVMLPRERDTNRNEVIVDNDLNEGGQLFSQPYYKEISGVQKWTNGEFDGFIYDLPDFRDTENPFEGGTYRQTATVKSGKESVAAWYADIPEEGEYAVYVSYKSLPNSTTDARYTVNYSGGSKSFLVNQKMGGSTWIYLGTFPLEKGYSDTEPVVTLTNLTSGEAGTVVTADAVKIGGGMGNIARSSRREDIYYDPSTPEDEEEEVAEDTESEGDDEESDDEAGDDEETVETEETIPDETGEGEVDPELVKPQDSDRGKQVETKKSGAAPTFRISGYPRYTEGARYWLHWAGFPESVYSPYHGTNDYKDDYTGRAIWVNYLAGGSRVLPNDEGLGIPIDLSMALHSDAGKRADDSVVGTLGIYYTNRGASYDDGTARINSRMLTDLLMRQITGDIRQTYEPSWTRRSMWDKSYVEARIPEVPTALIELMSHQNFKDMQYGLDPTFRFLVGRSIYKAMARFMGERKDREVVIQPLPVKDFMIKRTGKHTYKLSWKPTPDKLEPTADPDKYIVYERSEGQLGFHRIGETTRTSFQVKVNDNAIHSFKIVAANQGGESFPSEILAMREGVQNESKPVLIINGFTRVSAPGIVNADGKAGFDSYEDFGVPYIKDISFSGYQHEFRRSAGESSGRSDNNYATTVIAGNTFDYPGLHGAALARTGSGFVSASIGAVEEGEVKLHDYKTIDLILGKQKECTVGGGKIGWRFKTFTPKMQKAFRDYVHRGGHLLVTGEYVATDLYSMRSSRADNEFASQVLGIEPLDSLKTGSGRIESLNGSGITGTYRYCNRLSDKQYIVEKPDQLQGTDNATELMVFPDTDAAAAVENKYGNGKVITLSVPLESFTDPRERERLLLQLLNLF